MLGRGVPPPDVSLLLIPLVLAGVFAFPFLLAWMEPKQETSPRHRATARRMPR